MSDTEKVAVLLASFNGADFLDSQITSIINQTYSNWHIFISDDGSTDGTIQLIHRYIKQFPDKISIKEGPRSGVSENFLSLFRFVCDTYKYVAFCDQDDVWAPTKLDRAVQRLSSIDPKMQAAYYSSTNFIDKNDGVTGYEEARQIDYWTSILIENPVRGHSLVLNRAAFEIISHPSAQNKPLFHDWRAIILLKCSNAILFRDIYPAVNYRLHSKNTIGVPGRFKSARRLLNGSWARYFWSNLLSVNACRNASLEIKRQTHALLTVKIFSHFCIKMKRLNLIPTRVPPPLAHLFLFIIWLSRPKINET